MLRSAVVTDVSGQPIGPIFKGQKVQEHTQQSEDFICTAAEA
jgi:hypothetical protein